MSEHLLQINTSLFSEAGASSRLADEFARSWLNEHPDTPRVVRDFAREPVPHLTADAFTAFATPREERDKRQQKAHEYSMRLIRELRDAKTVILGLPMYNKGVPSMLKAWFDHVARAGITFRYTEDGPEGLLADRPVYVLAARGGKYRGTPSDTQTAYVRQFLELLGIESVQFIYAEGLAMGQDERRKALSRASECIRRHAA